MPQIDLILQLLLTITVMAAVARKFNLSLPILLLLTGIVLSYVPGVRTLHLNPDMIFVFFLPPLLFHGAWNVSWRDVRVNMRIMVFLAIGLVLLTTVLVGFLAHAWIPGLSLGAAFILGAIISPTDAIAATAIIQQFRLPKRIFDILEEESLFNDATALVVYSFAVGAVFKDDHFSFVKFTSSFFLLGLSGIAIGLLVGWLSAMVWKHLLKDPLIARAFSFFIPYAAYLPAQDFGVSGVLAVVAAGMYLGWRSPVLLSSESRIHGQSLWETVIFLMNGFIFLITGMQIRPILIDLNAFSHPDLLWDALLISALVITIRLVYVYFFTLFPRWIIPGLARRDAYPSWRNVFIIAWSGMRGVVSLAAAFALPFVYDGGRPFPNRELILFLTFTVILTTIVFQGLLLPLIIKLLRFAPELTRHCDEIEARTQSAQAALSKLDELIEARRIAPDTRTAYRIRAYYDEQLTHLEKQRHALHDGIGKLGRIRPFQDVEMEILAAQRSALLNLRNQGQIDNEITQRIGREIDLQELKILT